MSKKPRKFPIHSAEIHGFTVRGLSFNDFAALGIKFGPALTILFKEARAQTELSSSSIQTVVERAAKEFPDLIGTVIAVACDTDDVASIRDANNMSIGDQVAFIEAIFNSTFRSESDIVKMIESLSKMLEKVSTAIETVPGMDTQDGIGS